MMRWSWWRRRRRERVRQYPERIPDGDTVLAPGQRRCADLLAEHGYPGQPRHGDVGTPAPRRR